ncbi:spore coat protein [Bacillus xiamenensis]|uniref:Spore coat protein n=1 Tax=Bacillus xiamenensis TaxID=1178537 RepID=A0AAC9IFW4_9BACI|nr:spore coat protein [Bacillus xiamenensis]AOZ87644.1 spore coat protein [Bacillus xiamenensis]MBG9910578.1 spore coat protein [Bacillus xiamenensis]MCY9575929.1 spore coat protein [Bacillus xiamenensis]
MSEDNKKQDYNIDTNVDPLTSLLVSDVLNKYNITAENRRPLNDEQKRNILKLVEDLQKKANDFVESQKEKKRQEETQTAQQSEETHSKANRGKRTTLRHRIHQRRESEQNNN